MDNFPNLIKRLEELHDKTVSTPTGSTIYKEAADEIIKLRKLADEFEKILQMRKF